VVRVKAGAEERGLQLGIGGVILDTNRGGGESSSWTLLCDISSDRLRIDVNPTTRPIFFHPRGTRLSKSRAQIPRLVRDLRQRTGLTQEKFAAKLGVTFPTINRWENGRAKPSPLALRQIEEFLKEMGHKGRDLLDDYFGKEKQ
jgi:putative transcriptional regulator